MRYGNKRGFQVGLWGLVVVVLFLAGAYLEAGLAQPSTTGAVAGTIYEDDGQTLITDEAFVVAVDVVSRRYAAIVDVSGNGSYQIALEPGDYKFFAAATNRAVELYDAAGQDYDAAATLIVVAGQTITGIDFTLSPGGAITGRVTDADGTPLADVNVSPSDQYGLGVCTDTNGEYTVPFVPLNTPVRLVAGGIDANFCNNGTGPQTYLQEYWQEESFYHDADLLQLTSEGQQITGIDFTLEQGGSIAGQVRAAENSSPLPSITVCAFPYADANYNNGANFRCDTTDGSGAYLISDLPVNTYRVWLFPQDRQRLFYDQSATFEEATPVAVTAGADVTGVDFSLPRAAIIAGLITDENGAPLNDVAVWVQPEPESGPRLYPECSNPLNGGADGRYRLYLPAGRWYVYVGDRGPCGDGTTVFPVQVYPTRITVTLNQTVNDIDFQRLSLAAYDVNNDGRISPSDGVYVINQLGTTDPDADVNGDEDVTALDVVLVLANLGRELP